MHEGVFFPDFWPEINVRGWMVSHTNKWFIVDLEQTIEGQYWFAVQPLRNLYASDRAGFQELVALFRLFGIEVRVAKGQGIFGHWQWQTGSHVITDTTEAAWPGLLKFVSRSQELRSLTYFVDCVKSADMFGLVLEQVVQANPLIDLNLLVTEFEKRGIGISSWPVKKLSAPSLVAIESADVDSKQTKTSVPANPITQEQSTDDSVAERHYILSYAHVPIEQIFDYQHDHLIINRFKQEGVSYLDQLTQTSLDKVLHSTGIGAKKRAYIQQRVADSGLLVKPGEQLDEHEIKYVFTVERENRLTSALINQGLLSLGQIMPSNILALPEDVWNYSSTLKLLVENFELMGERLPDRQVLTEALPYGQELNMEFFGSEADQTMSLRRYLFMLSVISGMPLRSRQKMAYYQPVQKHLIDIEHLVTRSDDHPADEQPNIDAMTAAGINVEGVDADILNYTWWCYQTLLPESLEQLIDDFYRKSSDRETEIITQRVEKEPPATLEAIAKDLGITRERVRQIQSKAVKQFSSWWQQMRLSIKLPIDLDRLPLRLDETLSEPITRLLTNTVAAEGQPLATFVASSEQIITAGKEALGKLCKDSILLRQERIAHELVEKHIQLADTELAQVMKDLGYARSAEPDLWAKQKNAKHSSLTRNEIVRAYMDFNHLDTLNVSQEGFEEIDKWTQRYLGGHLTASLRSFFGAINRMDDLIPIQNGLYRRFDPSAYNPEIFKHAKEILTKHFSEGYQFVRDNWLFERVKDQLPENMTSDEFYQVFKFKFPNDFSYSTGRGNDIFPHGSERPTISNQIIQAVRHQMDGCSLHELEKNYGWEFYTIQQAIMNTPSLIVNNNRVSWIDVDAAQDLLREPIGDEVKKALAQDAIVPIAQIYRKYNDFTFSHSEVLEKTRILNQAGLASYLGTLADEMGVDVVGGLFLVRKDSLTSIKRTNDAIWSEFLASAASSPMTGTQLRDLAVNSVGISQSTWDQKHLHYFEVAQIFPISRDRYLATRAIQRVPEVDEAVKKILENAFENHDFVAIQSISPVDLAQIPQLSGLNLPWTPELFASYATLLGYRWLQWSGQMLRLNYDALVPYDSQYQSLSELMAVLIDKWRETNDNETNLYDKAVKVKLMPDRNDSGKRRFSPIFYDEQGFIVDEAKHVRRK